MTPATLGPMACISRKLPGLASWPTFWDTRAAMGTADTPAEPMRGLIFSLRNRFMNLASSTPPAVPKLKATMPMAMMARVRGLRKVFPVAVAPTETPRKMVTMLMSSFCTVLLSRSVTPHSRNRLPSIKQAISGAAEGTSRATNTVTTMGNTIFSFLETSRRGFITILRSSSVVSSFIMGGWITGTRAM
ncbi:Uncharacterised protein [uncultured Blautia sp.]|nr:Uncharacterised protein [uncultured Blautia sp.]